MTLTGTQTIPLVLVFSSSLHLAQEGKIDAEKQDEDATFDLLAYLVSGIDSQ
jgi:hypothetical protein